MAPPAAVAAKPFTALNHAAANGPSVGNSPPVACISNGMIAIG